MIRHTGCVNRIRSFNFGSTVLAANWSEKGIVAIWDLNEMIKATNDKQAMNNFIQNKRKNIKPAFQFEGYTNEGYALDWNTINKGNTEVHGRTNDDGGFRTVVDGRQQSEYSSLEADRVGGDVVVG